MKSKKGFKNLASFPGHLCTEIKQLKAAVSKPLNFQPLQNYKQKLSKRFRTIYDNICP